MILLKENVTNFETQDEECGFKKFNIGESQVELNYKNFDNQQILNWFTKVEKVDA